MSMSDQINKAIAAHSMWKARLQEAISTGKSPWTVEVVRSASACDFGHWFDSLPQSEQLSKRGARIRELHAGFHASAAAVLSLALRGDAQAAEAAIGSRSEFSAHSAELTVELMKWKNAVD